MKKSCYIVICLLMSLLLFAGCGNSSSTPQESTDTAGTQEQSAQSESSAKKANVGDTVKADAEFGSFEVKVVSASRTDWYDESEDSEAVAIRFEINNIDYVGEYDEGHLNGYLLDDEGALTVLDSEGFRLPYYDISGPTDGSYAVSEDTDPGTKAKVSYPYIVPVGTEEVIVNINGQYEIPVKIGD